MAQHGITINPNTGQVSVDFNTVTREDILRANANNDITPEMAQRFLGELRKFTSEKEFESSSGFFDGFRKRFDPTDPRGQSKVFGVPVKTQLFLAGLGIATAGATAGVLAPGGLAVAAPTIAATTAAVGTRVLAPAAAQVTKKRLAVGAAGTITGLGAIAIGRDSGSDAQGTGQLPSDFSGPIPVNAEGLTPEEVLAAGEQARIDAEQEIKDKEAAFLAQGIQTETYEEQVWDNAQNKMVTTTNLLNFTFDREGNKQYLGGVINPLKDKIAQQNALANRESADQGRNQPSALESIQILEALADPFVANKLRFALARGNGTDFLNLGLPDNIVRLFGGSNAEIGNRVRGDDSRGEANLSDAQRQFIGVDSQGNAIPGATRQDGQPAVSLNQAVEGTSGGGAGDNQNINFRPTGSTIDQQGREVPGQSFDGGPGTGTGGLDLASLFALLQQPSTGEGFGPAIQSQLSPGTTRSLSDNQIGALRAAFINSGSTLQQEQRKARRSALA